MRYYKSYWQQRQDFKAVVMGSALLIAGMVMLCGCDHVKTALAPPAGYVPGENFGNGGADRCGTRQIVEADLKPCS